MTELSPTGRSTVHRGKKRAGTDRTDLHSILDEGVICHLGMQVDGSPRVLPTAFARLGETLYLHGSTGARSLREGIEEAEVCASVTLLDGIVYSRSAFHHSANYRSAVIHGRPREVSAPEEKWQALRAVTEHLAPGSWEHARQPDRRELAATAVLALSLDEASVKIRTGGPGDDEEDIAAGDAWAGVLPLHSSWGEPEPSPDLADGFPVPEHVRARQ
ncbi:hypothetical protein FHX42_000535 [Saccharopolyspora lacisalsi]|uniref:Flavin-nucleotide-binding protein n=1 Tax=Halosaccharopolyspora lacisalsi TaxID=1000566 RepID=A0A839DSG0_9PSEU|nr:pyridoxamine 5'-phosphate oxidase family protein [Halosaccharopolyspora lacisalsi]MBA8823206.1 hypothetical protein [Halosaccharopolyspora lacisalsi]